MSTTVCGVDEDYESASNSALELLFKELGRNGETKQSEEKRVKIEQILKSRKDCGVEIKNGGLMYYSV